MKIRKFTQHDIKDYLRILNQLSPAINIGHLDLDDDHIVRYVEEVDDHIVAIGTILFEKKLSYFGSLVGHIEDIVVDEQHRRKGYGLTLVNHLIMICKLQKCRKVILDCKPELVPFYEKLGLKSFGVAMNIVF